MAPEVWWFVMSGWLAHLKQPALLIFGMQRNVTKPCKTVRCGYA
ncbi:hypothetical protein [Leptolyngbya sp. CCY15150]|nr:hypothetical protein [Leptolyngbya sp. CCY15150]